MRGFEEALNAVVFNNFDELFLPKMKSLLTMLEGIKETGTPADGSMIWSISKDQSRTSRPRIYIEIRNGQLERSMSSTLDEMVNLLMAGETIFGSGEELFKDLGLELHSLFVF